MTEQNSTGREIKDRIEIATLYCNGDIELAKEVVKGNHKDVITLKARFTDENELYGLYIVFIARELRELAGIISLGSNSPSIYNHKPFDPWKTFEDTIERELNAEPNQQVSHLLKNALITKLSDDNEISSIINFINGDDFTSLSDYFRHLLEESLNVKPIANQMELENTSSVEFYRNSKSRLPIKSEEVQEDEEDLKFSKPNDPYAGNIILQGKVILSPTKGKYIKQLVQGDNIKILITEKTRKAINIASKLNAYTDGEMIPIIAEIDSYKYVDGFHEVYDSIAPYILVKIIEEENVRISTVTSAYDEAKLKRSKLGSIILLSVIIVALIVIILVILNSNPD
ncbi:MAG TPA: hypothetical protein ENI73_07645 [Spirochaetes bacterium]|nr:hypothetical protein [Spirochaetota bacterium]